MKKFSLIICLLAIISLPAFAQEDISGEWIFNVQTDMGSGSPLFTIDQDDSGALSGTYSGALGEAPIVGSIEVDGSIEINFSVQGNPIKYLGKLEEGKIVGTVDLAGMASGTFIGERKGD